MPQSDEFIKLTDINGEPFYVQVKTIGTVINAPSGNTQITFKGFGPKRLICTESPTKVFELIQDAEDKHRDFLIELANAGRRGDK